MYSNGSVSDELFLCHLRVHKHRHPVQHKVADIPETIKKTPANCATVLSACEENRCDSMINVNPDAIERRMTDTAHTTKQQQSHNILQQIIGNVSESFHWKVKMAHLPD